LPEEFPNADFYKVDVDQNEESSAEAGISCMPTFQFYKNGKKIHEIQGANLSELKSQILKLK
jgi:hypothetical protein